MRDQLAKWLGKLRPIFHSWYIPAALGAAVLIAFGVWIWPRKIDRVISADGQHSWDAGQVKQRQVLWEPAALIEGLLPEGLEGSLITPRLADGGASLYFTFRPRAGNADIYRSRLIDGQWQRGEPLRELNTESDDIGPALSRDGRQLYFYSNRPGGHGGFDLYVADRSGSGWSKPRNLGPTINSAAHEYDPAIAPDGLSLYFASNRAPGMAQQAAQAEGDWAATLRAHPGLSQFDLYASRRLDAQEEWAAPEPLKELNTAANEGAPYVSPSGNFLYFASDRPARRGEAPNLDLYRARLADGHFGDAENLGPGINTVDHETEPALSPEGFTLVFSSGRGETAGLYRSTAQEVYPRTEWDTSRLQAVGARWWQALVLISFLASTLAMFLFNRGWLFQKASAARFLAASALIHCLVLLGMWGLPLAGKVIEHAEEIRVSEQALFLPDDNTAQPNFDSRQSFEKVAELKSLAPAPLPQAVRQAAAQPNVPEPIANPLPVIPIEVARTLPPERLQFVPAKEPAAEVRIGNPDLPRRASSPREMAALPKIQVDPIPAEITPAEKAVEKTQTQQARQEMSAPPALELPRRAPQPVLGRPAAVEVNPAPQGEEVARVEGPRADPEKRQPGRIAEPARTTEKIEVAVEPSAGPKALNPDAAPVAIGRKEAAPPTTAMAPERAAPVGLAPRGEKLAETVQPKADGDIPRLSPLASLPGRSPARTRPTVAPVEAIPGPEVNADASAGDKPLGAATVTLPRLNTGLPEGTGRVPEKVAMPRGPDKQPAVVGNVTASPFDASPKVNAPTNTLTRQPARGTRVARSADNIDDKGAFLLREGDVRKEAIGALGGTKESEAAVERGLDWLASHQNRDGSWSLNAFQANCKHPQCTAAAAVTSDTGGTGLALLPFLAAGYTHKSGKHQQTVAQAVKWLLEQQRADGGWLARGDGKPMYGHGLASIALCEVYGMTKDPQFRAPAQKALDYIVKAQHAGSGGWRYSPNTPGDTSVLGWQVMAFKSGEMAGLSVPPQVLEGAKRWLKSVEAKTPGGGQFGYLNPTPTPAMTAQGLLCLQLMGTGRTDPRMQAGANYLLNHLPQRNVDTSYYWYHATQVMYHMQGKYWQAWNQRMRDMLVSTQITKGPMAGTWDPVDPREKTGGRICSTALRLLMLEVYYRHLPLYQHLEK